MASCCCKPVLELWGRPNAYNVQKVLWLLRELGLEFEHYPVGSEPGELDSAEFRALNPHGRIPVLRADDGVVWESNTILRYLAGRYGDAALAPRTPFARSEVERWMDWELGKLQPDFIDLFWGYYRTPQGERDARAIDAARARCARHMRKLDAWLETRAYLAGEDVTPADIACGVCLYRYLEMGLEVERPPSLLRWYDRLAARPAYRQTVMRAFDELAGRLDF